MTARAQYVLGQVLLKQAFLAVSAALVGFVVVGGLLYKLLTSDSFEDGAFKAYSLLNNVPGADATADETILGKLVSNALYMVGVATFAVIIGIVSDKISSSVESLRVSNERVQEVGHTVVVNWGDYTRPMMRQLEAARKEGRLSGPVVVLSEKDKEAMDEEVSDELKRIRAGLSVLTRVGSPVELNAMDRVAAGTASRIIVLPDPATARDPSASTRETTGLALALQRGLQKAPEKRAKVVVSAPSAATSSDVVNAEPAADGFGSYASVNPEDFISRILAQCAVQPALSHVYAELLLQGTGNEIYTEPLARHRRLHGLTFEEAARRFGGRAIPIGVVRGASASGGESVELAPSPDAVVGAEDSMILIADQKRDTRVTRARKASTACPGFETTAGVTQAPLKILLLNADPNMPDVIEQIDEVSPKGSQITLLAEELPKMGSLKHCSLKFVKGDAASPAAIKDIRPSAFDAVVCLQPGSGSEADDSKLLVALLALQQAAQSGDAELPRVVAEVHSPSMLDLIASRWGQASDRWDFVLPNELCAGILVQFALQPELRPVYSELLGADGKEFYLQPASLYCTEGAADKGVTFDQLSAAARARGELAIGIHRASDKEPLLNPARDLRLKLQPGDELVVLGDKF